MQTVRLLHTLPKKEVKLMIRYVIVSIISGILFGVLDGVINANPIAQRLFEAYKPIAKTSINPLAGIMIDLDMDSSWLGYFCFYTKACLVRQDLQKV